MNDSTKNSKKVKKVKTEFGKAQLAFIKILVFLGENWYHEIGCSASKID